MNRKPTFFKIVQKFFEKMHPNFWKPYNYKKQNKQNNDFDFYQVCDDFFGMIGPQIT